MHEMRMNETEMKSDRALQAIHKSVEYRTDRRNYFAFNFFQYIQRIRFLTSKVGEFFKYFFFLSFFHCLSWNFDLYKRHEIETATTTKHANRDE